MKGKRTGKWLVGIVAVLLFVLCLSTLTFAAASTVEVSGGKWKETNDGWIYVDEKGEMYGDCLVREGKKIFYLGADGYLVTNSWVQFEEGDQAYWRFFGDENRGAYTSDTFKLRNIGGKSYAFDKDGIMMSGWVISYENRMVTKREEWKEADYYFDVNDGYAVKGWKSLRVYGGWRNPNAKEEYWFYFDADSHKKVTSTIVVDRQGSFYVEGTGAMMTDMLLTLDGVEYEADSNGRLHVKLDVPTVTLSNSASSGKVVISWKAVPGAEKYEIYRATSKSGEYKKLSTTTKTTLTNTSTTAGKTYYYKVRAVAGDSKGKFSSVKSRTCDLARPTVTLSNVASSGKIKLSWDAVDGAEKYEVYRATSKSGTYKKIYTTANTSMTNTSTTAGKTYYYKVKAIDSNSAANSAYSSVKYRTCDLARPVVTVKLSSGKPIISWPKVDGAVKYEIYRATSKTGAYTRIYSGTSRSVKNTKNVTKGKTYYYKVKAIYSNTDANSAYSAVDSIKVK